MTDEAMSPLRRRMIEDMTIRKFAPKTQHDYVQRIKNFTAFLGRSPDRPPNISAIRSLSGAKRANGTASSARRR